MRNVEPWIKCDPIDSHELKVRHGHLHDLSTLIKQQ